MLEALHPGGGGEDAQWRLEAGWGAASDLVLELLDSGVLAHPAADPGALSVPEAFCRAP